MYTEYIGHPAQLSGIEESVLTKGKGKGMTLLRIRNGKGLELTLSPDRCMDIPRVTYKGDNIGFFAPCGYVAPQHYDKEGAGFLKSFTAGFMTTCGIGAVGSPCEDDGEVLPLHGTISNTPCEDYSCYETETALYVTGTIRDAALFNHSYLLTRSYVISKEENSFEIRDTVQNVGNTVTPCMLLYHINFGYPMLSENAQVFVPNNGVSPRNAHAAESIDSCLQMEKPQAGYEECCYYYDVTARGNAASVGIYNPDIAKGVGIRYDKTALPYFTEWKMMGQREYVLGLEPGNCTPDGRDVMRRNGTLISLAPGETYNTHLQVFFTEDRAELVGHSEQ